MANHAYGLVRAGRHPPVPAAPRTSTEARLAVDALGAVVGGLAGRLGEAEPSLHDALAQIRLTYVQISEMVKAQSTDGAGGPTVTPRASWGSASAPGNPSGEPGPATATGTMARASRRPRWPATDGEHDAGPTSM